MLTLTVLGSGTSIPSHRRAPAHLVQAGATTVLLDCGSGCETGLFLAGVTLDRLDAVLLTHLHPDHTAGLLPLLFALVNPLHPRRSRELPIHGPAGTAAHLAALEVAHGRYVQPPCGVTTEELVPPRRVDIGALRVSAFAVEHTAGSLAFRLEHGGAVLCYSGDSGPCDTLVEAARGADLFLCECAALEVEAQQGHLTPRQVGAIARDAGCARVVLTHLYPHVERDDPLPGVRSEFPGPVELAEDGRRFEIPTKNGAGVDLGPPATQNPSSSRVGSRQGDEMKKTQFSLVLANKAGELARLASVLAEAKVNIQALSITDGIHTGVVKVVVDQPDQARGALEAADIQFTEQQVLSVPLANTPGSLAELCSKLAKDGLSIDYVYGSTCIHDKDKGCDCKCSLMVSVADLATAEGSVGMVIGGWPRP